MYKPHRPRIHLACLFGLHDKDLLPHWIRHYLRYAFDTYTLFFHAPGMSEEQREGYSDMARVEGIDALFVSFGYFASGSGRASVMRHMAGLLPPDDYLVTADSDEFHRMEPSTYRDIILDHDAVLGNNVDCWDSTLHYADEKTPLSRQFSMRGDLMAIHQKAQTITITDKVMACRAGIGVNFTGSHHLATDRTDLRLYEKQTVDHYRWRPCVFNSFKDKFYLRLSDMQNIMDVFHVTEKPSYYDALEKREIDLQKSKGWMPGENGDAVLSPVGAENLPDMTGVLISDGPARDQERKASHGL